jgi:hypothetical protein
MIKRLILLTLLLTLFSDNYLFPQAKGEIKIMYYEAESYILFEDYKEALPFYQSLLKFFPTNTNYKYRLGQCYLNIPGEKDKAIGFLEDAVKNINPDYKQGKLKETGAPYDALYYLANAYRINNQLDKAIETYKLFKENLDTKIYDPVVVDEQIQSCINAKELMSMPLFLKEQNLGSNINEDNSEFNPVISDDEKIMVFSKNEAFYDAILYSTRSNGEWSAPINLNEALKVDQDLYPTSISADGKTLYLYSSKGYDGIIYSSSYENGAWSTLVKLNDNINTKYWESHATISHDNKRLYFTSNRKSSLGELDIYVSSRDSTGDWGPPVNLGPVINTRYHEDTPFLSNDDKTLYFSSRGHFNMGGYDIFYSTLLENGEWSVPLNLGYPLNSTDDDVFFNPINEGYEGYTAKYSPDGFGHQDIYRMEIFSDEHPRKFTVRGVVTIADLLHNMDDRIKITALNTKKPDQVVVVYSNPETGEYELQLPHGNYDLTYEGLDGTKIQKNIDLALTHPSDSFLLPGTILPRTDFIADLSVESENIISAAKGDTITFPVKAEPGSMLVVEHWAGDSLLYTEQFPMTDSTFYYKMVPQPGENKVTFIVTDRFNNTTTADVLITRKPDEPVQQVIGSEYNRVISEKQIAALTEVQMNRAGPDVSISSGKDKILALSESSEYGEIFKQAVAATGEKGIRDGGEWMQSVYNESIKQGLTDKEFAKMIASISSLPGTDAEQFLRDLAANAEEPFLSWLNSLDLKKEGIKTPEDLILFILKNKNKVIPEELIFQALANLIDQKDIPAETIKSAIEAEKVCKWWILWLILGTGAAFFLFYYWRRRKERKRD